MKKCYTAGLALLLTFTLTACASADEAATFSPAESTMPAETAEPLKTIGTAADSDTAVHFPVSNHASDDIKAIQVKEEADADWSDNLLGEDDVFTSGEDRIAWFDVSASTAQASADSHLADALVYASYDVQLTFGDDTASVLHDVPLEDMKSAVILRADEDEGSFAYLNYTDTDKNDHSTYDAEKKIYDDAQAAAEKAAAEKAAAEQAAAEKAAAEKAAQEQAAQQAQAAQSYQAPVQQAPAQNNADSGCLDGADLY